jgi:monoamine oxidase
VTGKIAEGGGELIGSNHPLWNSYKHHFGLSFTDVKDYGNSPFRLKGKTLSADESKNLTDQIEEQLKLLTNLAESIVDPFEPWTIFPSDIGSAERNVQTVVGTPSA